LRHSPFPNDKDEAGRTAGPRPDSHSLQGIANELEATIDPVTALPAAGSSASASPSEKDDHPNLSILLSRAGIGILHRDIDRRVIVVNDRYCELVGRSADDLAGRPFEDFIHPDDLDDDLMAYAAHLERAEPFESERRYIRPDGSVIWCAEHVSFVTDEAGRAVSSITIARDITARRRALEELRESEEHYRYTVEYNPQITWTADRAGAVDAVSTRWLEVTGIHPRDALGERWIVALHPDDIAPTLAAWGIALETREPVDVEYRVRGTDGKYRWFRARASARVDAAGEVVRWYGTLEDVDARKLAEQKLRESEERFRLAAEAAGLGIWDYDVGQNGREWSGDLRRMFGVPDDMEPTIETALNCVLAEDRHLVEPLFAAAVAGDSDFSFQATFRIRRLDDGRERWMSTGGWRTFTDGGTLSRVLVTMRDVTEERDAEARVRWTAMHDPLTSLPNRAHFNDLLADALAKAETGRGHLALLLLDVDRLKETNDLIGHDAGDELLRNLAQRALEAIGPTGIVARLGGDEFAMLMPGGDADAVRSMTARLMPLLREPFTVHGYTLDCQATAGCALYPEHGTTATDLLKAADVALYIGKASDRGGLSIFEAQMRADLQRRASMMRAARTVVNDNLVIPFYQPKVSLSDGAVVGFEALLRWKHTRIGIQGPGTIGVAFEDIDLATALSDRMLDQIVPDMRRWLEQGYDFGRIAFNLSPAEFRSGDLERRILRRLRDAQIPSSRLELEVTEQVLLGPGAESVGATLKAFHDAGISIALDDFGTGYASLTHLKAFPVDVIKIDQSFISSLTTAPGDAAIVHAVIGLGRDLGMDVVAEGVETEAQAAQLRDLGCKFAQGYLFGRAMPVDEASALIAPARPPRQAAATRGTSMGGGDR
jgi:diguanylate cyclase (GGDEF)-like protein/PAS domain S-box-containing protein